MMLRDKVRRSFAFVKRDIAAVKISFTDWVVFLKRRNDLLEQKVIALEKRVEELEQSKKIVVY